MPGRRRSLHLSRRGCRPDIGRHLPKDRLSEDDQGDNGSEFISRDLDLCAYGNNVTLDFSRPGKPTDNGFIEAFNSKLRSECLNALGS
jgi:hypothetical protein